ncbi:hypothetical protein C8R45DRAFT_843898, partial [Mycena sanguinolenta]
GWCCIPALGDFDADRGGHLILQLVIHFPASSAILISFAILCHSWLQRPHCCWPAPLLVWSVGLFRWAKTQPQIPERPVDQRGPGNSGRQNMLGGVGHRTRWQTRSKE